MMRLLTILRFPIENFGIKLASLIEVLLLLLGGESRWRRLLGIDREKLIHGGIVR